MWPSIRVTGSTTTRLPLVSRLKPFGVWIVIILCSSIVDGLLDALIARVNRGVRRRHAAPTQRRRRPADRVGVGFDAELMNVGEPL